MIQLTTPGCYDIIVFEERQENTIGGISHLVFRLINPSDIDIIYQKVKEAKYHGRQRRVVSGSPCIFFKDPDGYVVEVWYELVRMKIIIANFRLMKNPYFFFKRDI